MTKLISFVVFIVAFIWTWFLFNSQSKISLATHAGIQSKFILLIEETVKNAKPNSSNFEILNISTEKIDDNQISAQFSYKYTDEMADKESVEQVLSGHAVLYRGLSEDPATENWIVKSIKTDKSTLEFHQGMIINPEAEASQASADATEPLKTEEKKNE